MYFMAASWLFFFKLHDLLASPFAGAAAAPPATAPPFAAPVPLAVLPALFPPAAAAPLAASSFAGVAAVVASLSAVSPPLLLPGRGMAPDPRAMPAARGMSDSIPDRAPDRPPLEDELDDVAWSGVVLGVVVVCLPAAASSLSAGFGFGLGLDFEELGRLRPENLCWTDVSLVSL